MNEGELSNFKESRSDDMIEDEDNLIRNNKRSVNIYNQDDDDQIYLH